MHATSRSSLRLLGSVGEPINPEAWRWYYDVVGGGRCALFRFVGFNRFFGGFFRVWVSWLMIGSRALGGEMGWGVGVEAAGWGGGEVLFECHDTPHWPYAPCDVLQRTGRYSVHTFD